VKKCSNCNIEKIITEFHKHKYSKGGYRSKCKECRKNDTKEYCNLNRSIISLLSNTLKRINTKKE
jgi:hypothetical protein